MSYSDLLQGLTTSIAVLETAGKLAEARKQLTDAEAAHLIASPRADQAYAAVVERNRGEWKAAHDVIAAIRIYAEQARTAAAAAIETEEDEATKAALPKPGDVYDAALAEGKSVIDGAKTTIERIQKEALAAIDAIIGPIITQREAASMKIIILQAELNALLTASDDQPIQIPSPGQPTDVRPDEVLINENPAWQEDPIMSAGHA